MFLGSSETQYLKTVGVASIGMGIFGAMITLTAFGGVIAGHSSRSGTYPVFWTPHLVGNLPPGKDHIRQVLFIALSLLGLLLPIDEFSPRGGRRI